MSQLSWHNGSRCRSQQSLARGLATSLREFGQPLEADSAKACNLTRRAADGGYAPRF